MRKLLISEELSRARSSFPVSFRESGPLAMTLRLIRVVKDQRATPHAEDTCVHSITLLQPAESSRLRKYNSGLLYFRNKVAGSRASSGTLPWVTVFLNLA